MPAHFDRKPRIEQVDCVELIFEYHSLDFKGGVLVFLMLDEMDWSVHVGLLKLLTLDVVGEGVVLALTNEGLAVKLSQYYQIRFRVKVPSIAVIKGGA